MINLLNKPLKVFTLYALIILACSIPVYYFIAENIWLGELDEHNKTVSGQFKENLYIQSANDSLLQQNIVAWNKLQPAVKLHSVESLRPDSLYTVLRRNKYIEDAEEKDRFRGLVSYFSIRNRIFSVTVESNIEETHETILAITIITLVFFLLLFTGFILLNRRISGNLWRPFYKTLQKVKDFELHEQQSVEFEKTNIIEFAELNNSLEKLIGKDISVFKEQKEFTENASHELQTPLAIIQSKLDLLMQTRELTAEQSKIIEDAEKALGRMSRINKSLLLLAKIGNSQFTKTESVNISALLTEQAELLAEHIAAKNLDIETSIRPDIHLTLNRILAETMVSNLLTNAIRYTDSGGKILVELSVKQLSVSNTGDQPLEKEKLFKRFGNQSESSAGSGLGLAIIQQVVKLYRYDIRYFFENGLHCFSINF